MVAQVLPQVPEEARAVLSSSRYRQERDAVKFTIRCGLDMTNSLGRSVASTKALRHHAWLRTSGFSGDVQQSLMDMPFNGIHLFRDKADPALECFQESGAMARSLGLAAATHPLQSAFIPFMATEGAPNRVHSPPAMHAAQPLCGLRRRISHARRSGSQQSAETTTAHAAASKSSYTVAQTSWRQDPQSRAPL
ncbi:hypothetical protein NDU88_004830 [Pleurodeles waltl]|uniref:Uncharacterized protein n=1 Tax=Pleurodeles waltl TaxID=8319 RepID=A0AAV7VK19_PLEWA|nr:hypothetical protein NDU88_004830 [Pleurodeles waltl]